MRENFIKSPKAREWLREKSGILAIIDDDDKIYVLERLLDYVSMSKEGKWLICKICNRTFSKYANILWHITDAHREKIAGVVEVMG